MYRRQTHITLLLQSGEAKATATAIGKPGENTSYSYLPGSRTLCLHIINWRKECAFRYFFKAHVGEVPQQRLLEFMQRLILLL